MPATDPPSRLSRQLGVFDATLIGLGSMIGAGVFVVFGLAAKAAGTWLLAGLGFASIVALCNAISSSQLAAIHPSSGGAYAYGRERLGPTWGFLAGWGFLLGKTASCAAMAYTIGLYLSPGNAFAVAVASVVLLTGLNYIGIRRTSNAIRLSVPAVILILALVVVDGLADSRFALSRLFEEDSTGPRQVLEAGGLIFFAFAGYARIGTLGEEVRQPGHTIPRAIIGALLATVAIYGAVAVTTLAVLGAQGLSSSPSPLADVVGPGWLRAAVRIGAVVAASGALLTLLAGVSRTLFAMADNREFPQWLAAVHPSSKTPRRAEIAVGVAAILALSLTNILTAVGFSSFLVLSYYAITNLAAIRLSASEQRWPGFVPYLGLLGCVVLAMSLPVVNVAIGTGLLVVGLVGRALRNAG